jgi:hypothetical protein
MSARARFPALAAALLSLVASCGAATVESFPWTDAEGNRLAFASEGGAPAGEEGGLSSRRPEALYRLKRPLAVPSPSTLEIDIQHASGLSSRFRFELLGGVAPGSRDILASFELGLPDLRTRIRLPLEAGRSIGGLRVTMLAEGTAAAQDSSILGLAVMPPFVGLEKRDGIATLSPSFSMVVQGAVLHASLERPFAALRARPRAGFGPALRIAWSAPKGPGLLELDLGGTRILRIEPGSGAGEAVLPLAAFSPVPARLGLDFPASIGLEAFAATLLPAERLEALDLGVILLLPPGSGTVDGLAGTDFDAYLWSLRPEVLVLDFADYVTQDRYLKRLAFFVEKRGYKGSLAPDAEIAGLHGWNAHDYRAADLARFFEAARQSSFQLGESELRLRSLLISRGLVVERGGAYAPGRGALISISRESPSWLRTTFAVHESSHALYFTDPGFASFVRSAWAGIGTEERWFWKLYFGWMNYDTANEDLMANEFMAYLIQQPLSRVEEYFTKTLPPRVLENHPELAPRVEAWMRAWGTGFVRHAAELQAWLEARYGIRAGRSWSVY